MDSHFGCWSRPSFFSSAGPSSIKPPISNIASIVDYRYSISALDQLFEHSMDYTTYPHSISIGDSNVNCGNVTNSNNTVNVNKIIADENPEIMRWLSPLDPRRRHQDVRIDRLDGVGNWLLETSEFQEWRRSEGGAGGAVLFCYGDPGVGKTYLR